MLSSPTGPVPAFAPERNIPRPAAVVSGEITYRRIVIATDNTL
jgi:hypothetical protein